MTLLPLPDPYDFELSTERFRAFGPDLANLWYEGGVHRVVGGREIRIEAGRKQTAARMNRSPSDPASNSAGTCGDGGQRRARGKDCGRYCWTRLAYRPASPCDW